MDYQAYGHDKDGNKVTDRKTRKFDRHRTFDHNKSLHKSRNKKKRKSE